MLKNMLDIIFVNIPLKHAAYRMNSVFNRITIEIGSKAV